MLDRDIDDSGDNDDDDDDDDDDDLTWHMLLVI